MFSITNTSRLMLLAGMALTMIFGGMGCTTANTTNLPTKQAWKELADKSSLMENAGEFFGKSSVGGKLASLNASKMEEIRNQSKEAMRSGTPIDALNEMVDAASQEFVRKLANNPLIRDSEYQMVMIVDDFTNESGITNPALENALRSVARKLQRNEVLRNDFVFISSSEEAAKKILDNTSGNWDDFDPFGSGEDTTSAVKYHPDLINVLRGEMVMLEDFTNWRMQLTLRMDVTHPRTRQIREAFEFTKNYLYHPDYGWITSDRDDELARNYAASRGG